MRATAAALLGLVAGLIGPARDAAAARFAIVVGNDRGHDGDAPLRFAERDTAQLAGILTRIGGFTPSTTVVLLGRTADELRTAIADLSVRLRATPGEHLALIYYSGHADAQALHMQASSFSVAEVREALKALPAAVRVLIVDACQAGVLTRPKSGGAIAGAPLTVPGAGEPARGLAILAASTGSELAQESDELGGSVFTHYLKIGLAGLADRNRDGEVSLSELFDYTADRTLAATMTTTTGPQHPTFRVDLTGRDDLVLARPALAGGGYGQLRLDVPGWYFVRRADGTIAAEVVSRGGESLALDPGGYEITRREKHGLEVAALQIRAGAAAPISAAATRSVSYGPMVRKGSGRGAPAVAYGLAVAATLKTPLAELGPSAGAAVAARADLRAVSVELRLAMGRALHESPHLSARTWDVATSAAVLRAHDVAIPWRAAGLTVAWGLDVGIAHVVQLLDDGDRRGSWSPFVGPLAMVDLRLGRRFFVRAELRAALHVLRLERAGAMEIAWTPALASAAGAGMSF
jgi:hypothetical protein